MSGVVCPVCYEDVKPGCEDLQAVAGCGHVFHELCFQQWLEYCHRKPSCPVCKQFCSKKDAHRLYFLSSGEVERKNQSDSSCSQLPKGYNDVALQARIQKLEAQIVVANQGLQSSKEQLQELDTQLADHKNRLEKAESARREAVGERDQYRNSCRKVEEDLNRCIAERSKLLDKNSSLARELAATKLAGDYGIDENEILRLSTVGQGNNKDDIIDTLIRSLVIRNKTYSDLVTKYSTLGNSERSALQKAERASEQLRRLRLRVQELEKALEKKENQELRALKLPCEQAEDVQIRRAHTPKQTADNRHKDNDGTAHNNSTLAKDNPLELGCSISKAKPTSATTMGASASLLQVPIRRELPQASSTSPLVPGLVATTFSPAVQVDSETKKRVYTSFSVQAGARGFQNIKSSNDKGSFILTGADGRGGRVTVLKPLQHLGLRTTSFPAPRQAKRCKQTSTKGHKSNESGGLSIDHFFDKAE